MLTKSTIFLWSEIEKELMDHIFFKFDRDTKRYRKQKNMENKSLTKKKNETLFNAQTTPNNQIIDKLILYQIDLFLKL